MFIAIAIKEFRNTAEYVQNTECENADGENPVIPRLGWLCSDSVPAFV